MGTKIRDALRRFLRRRRKAIVGLLAPVLVWAAVQLGVPLSMDQALLLAAAIVAVVVHQVPNEPKDMAK